MNYPIIFHITKEQAKKIAEVFSNDLDDVDENDINEMLDALIDISGDF